MKILIYTHGRSGSTNLLATLCKLYRFDGITEPFNHELYETQWKEEPPYKRGDPLPDNIVMKCITNQADGWIHRNAHQFDKVICLFRENFKETVISATNANEYGFNNKYVPDQEISMEAICTVSDGYKKLSLNMSKFDTPSTVVWYEDIYSGDYDKTFNTIKNIKEDLTKDEFDTVWEQYLKPEHRYRQEN